MNNDDLAERLRLPSFSKRDRLAGADRIDELVATCEELEAKLAECEARLEKAVESLTVIDALDPEGFVNGCSQSALIGLVSRMGAIARTTIEEIKGSNT